MEFVVVSAKTWDGQDILNEYFNELQPFNPKVVDGELKIYIHDLRGLRKLVKAINHNIVFGEGGITIYDDWLE